MRHLSEPNVVRAIEHFTQALAVNRNHGPSLVGLAECYLLQGVTYGSVPRGKATLLAREAIGRALALDGDHAAAVNADAQLRFYLEWDGDGAERAFQRALELSPNSDGVHQHYAMFLVARDRMDAALSQVQSAVAIDPASIPTRAALGMIWHYTGNQRQAERTFREVLDIDGGYSQARKGLVRTLLAGKHYAQVLGLLDGWAPGLDRPAGSFLPRRARYRPRRRRAQLQEARRIADQLLAGPKTDGEVDAAAVLVALGDMTSALALLEQAVQHRSARTLFLRHDARFDGLRADRALRAAARQHGLQALTRRRPIRPGTFEQGIAWRKRSRLRRPPSPKARKKTVSVKKIVAEINRTLAKLEPAKATAQAQADRRRRGYDPQSYALDRAIMSLRGARDVIEGTCVPGFDIPF